MPKITDGSWSRIENLIRECYKETHEIAHEQAWGGGTDRSKDMIDEARMSLESKLNELMRLVTTGLQLYGLQEELDTVRAKWSEFPPGELRQTNFIPVSNGEFAESKPLEVLQISFQVLTSARESELAAEIAANEKEERQAALEENRNRLQAWSGLGSVVVGGLLALTGALASKCTPERSLRPASVSGAIEGAAPEDAVAISCKPELDGLTAIATYSMYVVQTDGKVPLPTTVVCSASSLNRVSEQIMITIVQPGRQLKSGATLHMLEVAD